MNKVLQQLNLNERNRAKFIECVGKLNQPEDQKYNIMNFLLWQSAQSGKIQSKSFSFKPSQLCTFIATKGSQVKVVTRTSQGKNAWTFQLLGSTSYGQHFSRFEEENIKSKQSMQIQLSEEQSLSVQPQPESKNPAEDVNNAFT